MLCLSILGIPSVRGTASGGRTLFFSALSGGTGTLTFPTPPQSSPITNSTFPLNLFLPTIIGLCPRPFSDCSTVDQNEPITAHLWLTSNSSSNARVQVVATYHQAGNFTLGTSPVLSLNSTIREYNVTYTTPTPGIQFYAGIRASLTLSIQTVSSNGGAVVFSGPGRYSSFVVAITNYASIQSVKVTDYRGAENQTFNIQAPPTQNIVFVTVDARDVFQNDISAVNLTISGPSGPIRGETNVTMDPFCPQPPCQPPSEYQLFWVYPTDSPIGTYSVTVSMLDGQGNVIHDTTGVHSFGIGPIPAAFPLLLFAGAIGGLGAAGLGTGAIYVRRRRTREYLAPFSYFERLTGGEVPGGSMVTVEGNTGAGKTTLCSEIMYEDLKRGRPCLYVAADDFPDRIREQMRSLGIDVAGYEKSGLLTFVDCYSAEAGRTPTEKFFVPSVGDLTTLGVKISSALENQKGTCLYLDSLSPFVPRSKPEIIVTFVHAIGAKVRGIDGKAFFTMSTGSDASIQRPLEDMADCVIQMEAFEEKDIRRRRLRIRKFRNRTHQEAWATFTIESGKGIIFYTRNTGRNN